MARESWGRPRRAFGAWGRAALRGGLQRLGVHVFRALPRGVDPLYDVGRRLPDLEANPIVVDVGAHRGESTARYRARWPDATIHAFEPSPESFRELAERFEGAPHIHLHPCALGSQPGTATLLVDGSSDQHRLGPPEGGGSVAVPVDTFDRRFAGEQVGYLKIDAEGHELDILRGAERALDAHHVDLLELEAGINPDNERHVALSELSEPLLARGYRVVGFYEQMPEWPTRSPVLRRVNALFASPPKILEGTG